MRVVFRATASKKIGTGHIMRCLTLSEALCKHADTKIEFVTQKYPKNLDDLIKKRGFIVHSLKVSPENKGNHIESTPFNQEQDAKETIEAVKGKRIDWIIIDHYELGYIWQEKIRPFAKNIMVIDDLANRRHNCDLLLDQNYNNNDARYDDLVTPDTLKLLGPSYALLRKEFSDFRNKKGIRNRKAKRLFIFFGGSDFDNLTSMVLKILSKQPLNYLELDVVIGALNPYKLEVKSLVDQHPKANLHIQVENLAALMSKADFALCAGGSSTWERMSVGLPSIVITNADNQNTLTSELNKDGYIKWLGTSDQVSDKIIHNALKYAIQNPQQLELQSQKCKTLVDSLGAERVCDLMLYGVGTKELLLRKANNKDCQLFWYWVNDPLVRENAFNQQQIALEDHQIWFKRQLNNPDVIMLIAESEYGPVAQVRFDREDSKFTISYSIANQFRGFGLGKTIISKAIDYLKNPQPFTLIAEVKEGNISSQKIFEKIGFNKVKSLKYNQQVYTYHLQVSPKKLH